MNEPTTNVRRNGALIEVENLVKYFPVRSGIRQRITAWVQAVDNVSFSIVEGETVGLVGESGCGKTTVGRTIIRLLEPDSGSVYFDGTDVMSLRGSDLLSMRRNMQIIFQDPYSSLDPRKKISQVIGEGLKIHKLGTAEERHQIVLDMMRKVGLEDYHSMRFPHEFSGGQRQRIGIARALVLQPKFIIADEPVSALDVSIQAKVLNLLKSLQDDFNLTYLFIAHNMGVVDHFCDRVMVMYLGKIVEIAHTRACFSKPLHPYTQALLSAVPVPNPHLERKRIILRGEVPSPLNPPSGCRFHTRCPISVLEVCSVEEPELRELLPKHFVACHFAEQFCDEGPFQDLQQ